MVPYVVAVQWYQMLLHHNIVVAVVQMCEHLFQFAVALGWTVATVGNVSVVYGLYNMMNGHPVSVGVSAFYNAVSRTVWAIGVAWVIFACVTGHGGK